MYTSHRLLPAQDNYKIQFNFQVRGIKHSLQLVRFIKAEFFSWYFLSNCTVWLRDNCQFVMPFCCKCGKVSWGRLVEMHHPQMQMHIWNNTDIQLQKYMYGYMVSATKKTTGAKWNKMFMPVRRTEFKLEVREQMYLPASVRAMKRDILIVCEDIKFGRRRNMYIARTFNWLDTLYQSFSSFTPNHNSLNVPETALVLAPCDIK